MLYTNGAASKEGSGAGLILTNPEGNEVTYALRFDFDTTNNKAEDKALLVGLRLVRKMGVKTLKVMIDSVLVINQINGLCDTKNARMWKYVAAISDVAASFEGLRIEQIKTSENKRADTLSKLVATTYIHLSKKVLVEILRNYIIDDMGVDAIAT